jgi:lysylphosphatidylglycerol synthetase-like protein (DUF2156 family)
MADGVPEALTPAPVEARRGGPGVLTISIPVGRRVLVAANLLLTTDDDPASRWAAGELARALETWSGPGVVVVAGGLFDVPGGGTDELEKALDTHRYLTDALKLFTSGDERRVVYLPGPGDTAGHPAALGARAGTGVETAETVELRLATSAGERLVRVEPGAPAGADESPPALAVLRPDDDAAWQHGLDRLADPAGSQRFLASRLLYRRFARLAWWLVVPLAVALALRLPVISDFLDRLFRGHPAPTRALARAHLAGWGARLAVAALVTAAEVLVLVAVLAWLSRHLWRTMGGGRLGGIFDHEAAPPGATANDPERDRARGLVSEGWAGLVSGRRLQAELSDLGGAFFASPGLAGEIVEEHPGRLGLPPVFLEHRQVSWIELETGAELHARLLLARSDTGPATLLERLAGRRRREHDLHPVVVAAHPMGSSWPPAPDLGLMRRRSRRVRRWAALAIAFSGVVDLISAVTPPLRGRLHLVLQILPLAATQAAGAVVALAGIGLLALARGVRRGQHRAWGIASVLLGLTLALHLVRGGDVEESALSAAVLTLLLVFRAEFKARADSPSMRSALLALVAGVAGIAVFTTAVVELTLRFMRRPHHFIALWRAAYAVVGRLVGMPVVTLPDRLDDFLGPSLLAVGIGLAVVAVLLATRPVVDRRLVSGRAAELRARDITKRHGGGTLDYFALRSDKKWFFHRDSLVAYAIYGGVCLVSPDPIGPRAEREQVWAAFRRFVDHRGWTAAVMGASEEWLPLYRASGMHHIYIGDEALVDVARFSLAGGHMKGLRQAHNRIAKYGYTASFHDPSRLDPQVAARLVPLMSQSRRGEFERGFSMMLGRIFDPRDTGLVLCVVAGPHGEPAAMCQFVPAPGMNGYSLDLMRRDRRGEHPNGLIDFALVESIEHFGELGCHWLSLNFAAMRSILEGERGDGVTQRVERWALQKMSGFLQIETLWRFNAKYGPDWLPRYVVYDSAEHLVPEVLAILRAESLGEVPVIGRVLVRSQRRAALTGAGTQPLTGEPGESEREAVGAGR